MIAARPKASDANTQIPARACSRVLDQNAVRAQSCRLFLELPDRIIQLAFRRGPPSWTARRVDDGNALEMLRCRVINPNLISESGGARLAYHNRVSGSAAAK